MGRDTNREGRGRKEGWMGYKHNKEIDIFR